MVSFVVVVGGGELEGLGVSCLVEGGARALG